MGESVQRDKVRFTSDGTECVAWHYPGTNGGCVIMAGGLAVPKEPGTDRFARRFHEAGFTVLAFDYRRLGESGGGPRLVLPIKDQLADWHAAVAFAATLPDVDPTRIALWAFSASGGYLFDVAATNPGVAAAIAQAPHADGPTGLRNAASHQKPLALLRFTGRGILDTVGGLLGRRPLLVPLVAAPGTVAMLSTPDGLDGPATLNPGNKYPQWQQTVAARSALRLGFYRPGRRAARVRCPLLVLVCDQDQTAPPGPAIRAAHRAPKGELIRIPGGHYEPFLDGHEKAVEVQLSFLRRHLLSDVPADRPAVASTDLSR
ncbi:MAG TPA: alpha/beta hydrolase [Pseudonocardia sp.]